MKSLKALLVLALLGLVTSSVQSADKKLVVGFSQIGAESAPTTTTITLTLPGPSLADKDLYILTSHDTFSAPEAFAYDMQALGRAKIVGEVTGGGAHGTKPYRLSAHFIASIPFNRGISAVTHTDYEGVGVKPDVQVPAKEALLTAHILALRGVLARTTGEPERKAELEKLIGELEAKLKSGNVEE